MGAAVPVGGTTGAWAGAGAGTGAGAGVSVAWPPGVVSVAGGGCVAVAVAGGCPAAAAGSGGISGIPCQGNTFISLSNKVGFFQTFLLRTLGIMEVNSIAECSHGAFCSTFDLH